MKDQINTIRAGLAIAIDAEVFVDKPVRRALLDAVKAAAQLEAMAGAQEPVAWINPKTGTVISDKEKTMWRNRCGGINSQGTNDDNMKAYAAAHTEPCYAAPPTQQPQYEAGDVASASAQGFRDGVASVTQQPQEPVGEVVQAFADLTAISWADNGGKFPPVGTKLYTAPVAQQPQAETDNHEAQGQLEFLDKKNNALSAAIRKVMARLADLLDEDQFKEIEEIVSFAGVQPQAEEVPLTHVLVPVDEPTDEMVDAACAAVDGLCRVDFVRAYVAAFAHLKAGYRDESYWCGWNAAIKFQQAEAVPSDVVRDAERLNWLLMQVSGKEFRRIGVEYSGNCQRADIDAALAQQKGQP